MEEYPKIETLFVRDEKTGKVLTDRWRLPEFEYLAGLKWRWTEKIDGTNIRIGWGACGEPIDGPLVRIGGRTDRAQIPATLVARLQQLFTVEKMEAAFPEHGVTLYGEGYGSGIQKGGGYKPDGVDFILFDIRVGEWWLKREDVEDIAAKLEIGVVPVWAEGALFEAVEAVRAPIPSRIGQAWAEGFVVRPMVDIRMRNGQRIIGKIKTRDFS
jgi:hypothetical protein